MPIPGSWFRLRCGLLFNTSTFMLLPPLPRAAIGPFGKVLLRLFYHQIARPVKALEDRQVALDAPHVDLVAMAC